MKEQKDWKESRRDRWERKSNYRRDRKKRWEHNRQEKVHNEDVGIDDDYREDFKKDPDW